MRLPNPKPVESAKNLRERVDRLLRSSTKTTKNTIQLPLESSLLPRYENKIEQPSQNLVSFLNFISDAMPDGDVYLFGGVLRDLALLGRRGFNSDIDLVVEGNWSNFVSYLESLKAYRNKFGGYRLTIGGWPIDIWNARETWAIKQGLVPYKGIASLTNTTVLNWDAILMSWRTRSFIHRKNYFEEINLRALDIVLEQNPNPLGMAVRVFRHLCLKDARKLTPSAAKYLANCARTYSFADLKKAELSSYPYPIIKQTLYNFFKHIDASTNKSIKHQFGIASSLFEQTQLVLC